METKSNFELSGKGEIVSETQVDILEAQKDIDLWNEGLHRNDLDDGFKTRVTLTKYKNLCTLLRIRLNEICGSLPTQPVKIKGD